MAAGAPIFVGVDFGVADDSTAIVPLPRCRICGCTDAEACELEHRRAPGRLPADAAARLRERFLRARPAATCSWIRPGLCSRCAWGILARRARIRGYWRRRTA